MLGTLKKHAMNSGDCEKRQDLIAREADPDVKMPYISGLRLDFNKPAA